MATASNECVGLIRYPGSKAKLANKLLRMFPPWTFGVLLARDGLEYREPFFGAGAVGWHVLKRIQGSGVTVWLNDIDPGIVALWRTVRDKPGELEALVKSFTPTPEAFYEFKEADGKPTGNIVTDGFRKLALHRMSVSGFGWKAGGPIGGRHQTGREKYTVGCRWNPEKMQRRIRSISRLLESFPSVKITCQDFDDVMSDGRESCFYYLDPPYFEKGNQLYRHAMVGDHERLCESVKQLPCEWVLSYDDHPEIRRLYSWAAFHELEITYTNAVTRSGHRPKNREVAICPIRKTVSGRSAQVLEATDVLPKETHNASE